MERKKQRNGIGVIKQIDKEGRMSVPMDMRKLFNMGKKVEVLPIEEGILIRNPEYVLVKKADISTE